MGHVLCIISYSLYIIYHIYIDHDNIYREKSLVDYIYIYIYSILYYIYIYIYIDVYQYE